MYDRDHMRIVSVLFPPITQINYQSRLDAAQSLSLSQEEGQCDHTFCTVCVCWGEAALLLATCKEALMCPLLLKLYIDSSSGGSYKEIRIFLKTSILYFYIEFTVDCFFFLTLNISRRPMESCGS